MATLAIASCPDPFSLIELLDGPDGRPLTITPSAAVLGTNQTVLLMASGGHPPYVFSMTGVGALMGDVYHTQALAGPATVTVTDAVGSTTAAEFSVSRVDYLVSLVPPGGRREIGSAIRESFTITNGGVDDGAATVTWTAYLSSPPTYHPNDPIVASGSITKGLPAGASATRTVTGDWPATSGVRYLIVRLTASDDGDTTNNTVSSHAYLVEDPAIVDYVPFDLSMRFPVVTAGSPISETFALANVGGLDGNEHVTWIVYASSGRTPDPSDEVGRGTLDGLPGGAVVEGITAAGSWPTTPGDYFLIVEVDAPNEANPGNHVVSSAMIRVIPPPDYRFDAVIFPAADYGGHPEDLLTVASDRHGGPTGHTFEIAEVNGVPGQQSIEWRLYQSDDAVLDSGDALLRSGVVPPLPAGGTTGTMRLPDDLLLPSTPGRYYYILKLAAGDDGNASNDTHVIGPVNVWSDDIANDSEIALPSTYDHFVQLNPGDEVTITGSINVPGSWDRYPVTAGVGASEFRIVLEWAMGPDLDIWVSDPVHGTHLAISQDRNRSREPAGETFDVPVNPGLVYVIDVYTYPENPPAATPRTGEAYTLTIRAYP